MSFIRGMGHNRFITAIVAINRKWFQKDAIVEPKREALNLLDLTICPRGAAIDSSHQHRERELRESFEDNKDQLIFHTQPKHIILHSLCRPAR